MEIIQLTYQSGNLEVKTFYEDRHLWVTSEQMAGIVGITSSATRNHLGVLQDLDRIGDSSTVRTYKIERTEGSRKVTRAIKHYSQRVVLLVALRSNSDKAAGFQEWVLDVLSELRQKGVVYAAPQPQLPDNTQELAELKAQVAKLQGVINECNLDMNEGQVPWFGGDLPKRVTYLIGSQKGVRPRAKLPMPPVLAQPLGERLLGIIRRYEERGEPATLADIRRATGGNTGSRLDKPVIAAELERLEITGKVRRVWLEGKRAPRFQALKKD